MLRVLPTKPVESNIFQLFSKSRKLSYVRQWTPNSKSGQCFELIISPDNKSQLMLEAFRQGPVHRILADTTRVFTVLWK